MSAAVILTGVMQSLGGPFSGTTLEALELWADSEGVPDSWNNPLATTLSGYGGTDVNSAGVKKYPSEQDGIDATVATLRGGPYGAVISAIKGNKGLEAIWSAVNASPWCGGCQSGKYPVALYDAIVGGAPPPAPKPGTPPLGGGAPPSTNPGIPGTVYSAWSALAERTGAGAGAQIANMTGYATIIREARR